jgi:hypothetical protein
LPQGADVRIAFKVVRPNGAAQNITGWQLFFTLKEDTDDQVVIIGPRSAVITNALTGDGYFPIGPSDTVVQITPEILPASGPYVGDVRAELPGPDVAELLPATAIQLGPIVNDGSVVPTPPPMFAGLIVTGAIQVRVRGNANVLLTGLQTINGVALDAGDSVLLIGQTDPIENGVWLVSATTWTRPGIFDEGLHAAGVLVVVQQGTSQADTLWLCSTNKPSDVIGTHPLNFAVVSGGGAGTVNGLKAAYDGAVSPADNIIAFGATPGVPIFQRSVATAALPMFSVENPDAALVGVQRFSPLSELIGRGWNSGLSASHVAKAAWQLAPIQGNPVLNVLRLIGSIDGQPYNADGLAITGFASTSPTLSGVSGVNIFAGALPSSLLTGIAISTSAIDLWASGTLSAKLDSGSFRTPTDFGLGLGLPSQRFDNIWGRRHNGVVSPQTVSGAVSFDPALGSTHTLLASGNVSSLSVGLGNPGEVLTLVLTQDAGGISTWPGVVGNCRLAGGAFSKSLAANAVDTLTFRYNSTASKWDEIGRAIALS